MISLREQIRCRHDKLFCFCRLFSRDLEKVLLMRFLSLPLEEESCSFNLSLKLQQKQPFANSLNACLKMWLKRQHSKLFFVFFAIWKKKKSISTKILLLKAPFSL